MNLDEFRRTLDELAGPAPPPSDEARAGVRQRVRRTRQRRGGTAAVVVLVVAIVVVVAIAASTGPARRVEVTNPGGVFPEPTGTVLILDDGSSGIVAVDLDHRLAVRHPTPGVATSQPPTGLVSTGDALIVGMPDVYAVPYDGSPPVSLGHATELRRAAEPNEVWLVTWPGGREGAGIPTFREVDARGNVSRQATGVDVSNVARLGFPAMGIPEGIAYETSSGVALWDVRTEMITARLGTGNAFVDDIHDDVLAWCQDLCATEHITRIGGADLTVSAPADAPSFDARTARFSPDGRYLAAVAGPSGPVDNQTMYEIVVIDTQTGRSRVVTPRNIRLGVTLAWSPDSQRLLFSPFADAGTNISLGEYVLATDQLHTATVPFWGRLGVAVDQSTAAPLLDAPKTTPEGCPPPVQGSRPTSTCAFDF